MFFSLNAVFLIWAILWKCGVPFIGDGTQRVINLVPFRGNTGWEMQFNVLLFVPFGFLLCAALQRVEKKRAKWCLLLVVCTSVFLEIVQYILAVSTSDITDVLLNTLGGVIGLGAYYLLAKLFGRRLRVAVVVACVCIAAFELYVSVSCVLFGMVKLGTMMLRM